VQIAKETLAALPFTLQTPAPDAWIDGIGDSTVTLRLIGWIDQRTTSLNAARGEAIRIAMAALSDAAIDMPEPTYRLTGLPALDPAEDTAPEPAPEPARPGSPVATPAGSGARRTRAGGHRGRRTPRQAERRSPDPRRPDRMTLPSAPAAAGEAAIFPVKGLEPR